MATRVTPITLTRTTRGQQPRTTRGQQPRTTLCDERVAVEKTPLEGDRADRQAEGRWLAEAHSPIVVRLLESESDSCVIRTQHGGQTTLRTDRRDPVSTARSLLALARGLVDLHDRGFVHGKLTLDHVIVTEDSVLLCSPSGTATDPTVDLWACGQMINQILARWLSNGYIIPARQQWQDLADRLSNADSSTSTRRFVRWLAPLVETPPQFSKTPLTTAAKDAGNGQRLGRNVIQWRPRRSTTRAMGVLLGVAVVAFLATAPGGSSVSAPGGSSVSAPGGSSASQAAPQAQVLGGSDSAPGTALEVAIDGRLFRLGDASGAAAVTPSGCPAQRIAYLEPETAIIWSFSEAEHDSAGSALAQVPGATSVHFSSVAEGCALWTTGPAGTVRLD